MILRKVSGPQFYLPIGKIKVECLHEALITIITNHPLANENWNLICSNELKICLSFMSEFIDITSSPVCKELGMYLETTIAILNRPDYRSIISRNFELFLQILDNLQSNPNNAIMCKCTVYKLPASTPFIIPCKVTTYYCFIEIVKLTGSPSELYNFVDTKLKNSKLYKIFIFMIFIRIFCYMRNGLGWND